MAAVMKNADCGLMVVLRIKERSSYYDYCKKERTGAEGS